MNQSAESRQRGTIVTADDDADMRRFYKTTLQSVGFNVFTANDGDACLALLMRVQPAVIILDVDMPRVTGFETLENIRRYHPHLKCPVIFSTVHQTLDSVKRAKQLGAASFLIKPVDANTLIDRVTACLRPKGPSYVQVGPN